MLIELQVRDLGVIEEVVVELGAGMTALTGETGAGKTLVVEALALLLGGRADPVLVRPGADEALVEGRFVDEHDEEHILARAVPATGRSRAWIDGRMATVTALAELGATLVDLHGQHAQQSLFDPTAQRTALDSFGGVSLTALVELQRRRRALLDELRDLGGDDRARAREVDLLRYQLAEIDEAALDDPDEDERLAEEEQRLADAAAHREAAATALAALVGDDEGGAVDRLGSVVGLLGDRPSLGALSARAAAMQAEVLDLASELRNVVETWEDDPERLAVVRSRRQQLHDLARKYGEGVTGVLAFADDTRRRLQELESVEARAAALEAEMRSVEAALTAERAVVGAARRAAAPNLGAAVEERLRELAMPRARLQVAVGEDDPGDDVTFLLGANPGEAVLPLAKVASGGELARAMLALRLQLSDAPPTMVFDEVDAGIGGEAAVSVGRSLAELGRRHQVLVVTHLAQVAAFADRQLVVRKDLVPGTRRAGERTVASVASVDGGARVVELARMLSGSPDSAAAHKHAEELLQRATVFHR